MDLTVIGILFSLFWGAVGYHVAGDRGRDPLFWGILCFLIGFFGLIVLAFAELIKPARNRKRRTLKR